MCRRKYVSLPRKRSTRWRSLDAARCQRDRRPDGKLLLDGPDHRVSIVARSVMTSSARCWRGSGRVCGLSPAAPLVTMNVSGLPRASTRMGASCCRRPIHFWSGALPAQAWASPKGCRPSRSEGGARPPPPGADALLAPASVALVDAVPPAVFRRQAALLRPTAGNPVDRFEEPALSRAVLGVDLRLLLQQVIQPLDLILAQEWLRPPSPDRVLLISEESLANCRQRNGGSSSQSLGRWGQILIGRPKLLTFPAPHNARDVYVARTNRSTSTLRREQCDLDTWSPPG